MSDPGPLLALRAGLIARFAADAALAALLGGRVRLYDEPPRGTLPVYALFGESEITDASVDGAERHRHSHAIAVIAQAGSVRTALDAAARMAALLADGATPSSCRWPAAGSSPSGCGPSAPTATPGPARRGRP